MIRMNVNRILPLMLLLVLFASCSRKYKVEGVSSVTSLDGKMLYLKTLRDGQWITIDSAEVVHGLFSTSGPPLVLENGKVEVSISNSQLTAKGTPLNNALYEFIEKRNALELKIEELEKKEARMVLDGAALDDIHEQLTQEGEALIKEMNDYIKEFISANYENVLGPSVFMMMCSTLPYPIMTPQIEDIIRTAPQSFKSTPLVREFIDKAKENMKLIEEHRRMEESNH